MKWTTLRGEPGALIDACIHLATTDDLHMQFDIVAQRTKHVQFSLSVQATVHDGLKNLYRCVFHENSGILTVK